MTSLIPKFNQKDITNPSLIGQEMPLLREMILERAKEMDSSTQETKSKVHASSWLNRGHPLKITGVEVSWDLLALFAGDSFIGELPIGNVDNAYLAAKYLEEVLNVQLASTHNGPFNLSESEASLLRGFAEEIQQIRALIETYNSLRRKILDGKLSESQRLEEVKNVAIHLHKHYKEKKCGWLPFGWVNSQTQSHFLLAWVQGSNFTFVTMGAGSNFHFPIVDFKENKVRDANIVDPVDQEYRFQCFKTLAGVDENELYSVEFFQTILELNVKHVWDNSFQANEYNIYISMPKQLGGIFLQPLPYDKYADFYVKYSRGPTCIGKVLLRALHVHLTGIFSGEDQTKIREGTDLYKVQKLLLHSHLLVSVCLAHLKEGQFTDLSSLNIEFLKDILDNLRDEIKKLNLRGRFEKTFGDLAITLNDIEERLLNYKQHFDSIKRQMNANVLSTAIQPAVKKEQLLAFTPYKKEEQQPVSNVEHAYQTKEMSLVQTKLSCLIGADLNSLENLQVFFEAAFHLHFNLTDPTSALNQDLEEIAYENKQGWLSLTRDIYLELIASLPIVVPNTVEESRTNFWKETDVESRDNIFQNIFYLMRTMMQLEAKIGKSNQEHDAKGLIATYTCVAIMDLLARMNPENKLDNAPRIAVQSFLLEVKNINFVVVNENWHKKLKEIVYYFSDEKIHEQMLPQSDMWNYYFTEWLMHPEKDIHVKAAQEEIKSLFALGQPARENGLPILEGNTILPSRILLWKTYLHEGNIFKNPTFNFYSQFIRGDDHSDISLVQQLVLIIIETAKADTRVLPSQIHTLRQACWLAQLYTHPNSFAGSINLSAAVQNGITLKAIEESSVPLNYEIVASVNNIVLTPDVMGQEIKLSDPIREQKRGQEIEDRFSLKFKSIINVKEPSHKVVYEDESIEGLEGEIVNAIRFCACDVYDSLNSALKLASGRLELLRKVTFRDWIRREILRAGKLPAQIKNIPMFGNDLKEFFYRALVECKEVGDWASWFEIAAWMAELKEYYDISRWGSGEFPGVRSELLANINSKKLKAITLLQSVQTLLLLYRPRFLREGLKIVSLPIVEDYFTYKTLHAFLLEGEANAKETSLSHTMKKCPQAEAFAGYIEESCVAFIKKASGHEINLLLNKLLSFIHIEKSDAKWTGEYPVYSNKRNVINLESGEISEVNGEVRSDLQEWIKKKNSFLEVIGREYTSIHKDSLGRFIVYPQQIYIVIGKDNQVTYLKEKSDSTSRTVSVPYEIKELFPEFFTQEVVCWFNEGSLDKRSNLEIYREQKKLLTVYLSPWEKPEASSQTINQLNIQIKTDFKKHKTNPAQTDLGKWQRLVRQSSLIQRAMNTTSDELFYHIGEIVRDDGKIYVSSAAFPTLLNLLKVFQRGNIKVTCWKNPGSKNISEVEITEIKLKFQTLGNGEKLYLYGTSAYYLTEVTEIPHLPLGMCCLVFKEGKSYKLKLPLVPLSKGLKSHKGLQRLEVRQQLTSINEWIDLSLNGEVLSGNLIDEKLYLLYIKTASQDYDDALDLLEQIRPLKALSKNDLKILEWIQNLIIPFIKKVHPKAVVIVMRLLLLMRRDVYKYKTNPLKFISAGDLAEIYKIYVKVQSNLLIKLRISEEKAVLKFLQELMENEHGNAGMDHSSNENSGVHFRFIDLLWDQLGWTRLVSLNEYQLFNDFKRRWMYLNGHPVEVGGQPPTKLPELSLRFTNSNLNISPSALLAVFRSGSTNKFKGDLDSFFIASSDLIFKNNFFYFYQIIRSRKEKEIKRLVVLLKVNAHLKYHSEGSSYRDLLYYLLKSQIALPDVESAMKQINDDKNLSLIKLMDRILQISKPKFKVWKEISNFSSTILTLGSKWITSQLDTAPPNSENAGALIKSENLEWDVSHLNHVEGYFSSLYEGILSEFFTFEIPSEEEKFKLDISQVNNPGLKERIKNDLSFNSRLDAINRDIALYRSELKKAPIFRLKSLESREPCYQKLNRLSKSLMSLLKVQALTIMWKANRATETNKGQNLLCRNAEATKGRRKKVTWNDLQVLFDRNDVLQFMQKTYLNINDAAKLMEEYALLLVNLRHFSRLKVCIGLFHQSRDPRTPNEIVNIRHQQIGDILASSCVYRHSVDNRDLLLVEAAQGGFLRIIFGSTTQLTMIEDAVNALSRNIIVKAPTGSGKSDILSKVIARRKMNSGCVLQTVPDSHEMVNAEKTQRLWKRYFGREVDRFEFDAGKKITRQHLDFDYNEIVEQLAKGTLLNTTHYSTQMYEVYFIWTLLRAAKTTPTAETKAIIAGFINQLRLWCLEGTNIIDEPDRQTPLDMVIVSYGKPLKISLEHIELIDHAMEALIDPEIGPLVGIQKNQQPMLQADVYKNIVVPFLVEHLRVKLKIDPLIENEYKDFVIGKIAAPLWLNSHPQVESIYLLYGLIGELLTSALEGYVDNDYGLYKLHFETKKFAGPYLTSNMPKENKNGPSQYFNYDSTFLRTLITYLYKGLDLEQTIKTFALLKDEVRAALGEGKRIDEVKNYDKIKNLIDDPDLKLSDLTEQDIKDLYPRVRYNSFLIREYIKKIVAIDIQFFNHMIISTPANNRSMFKRTIGLSATPLPRIQTCPKAFIVESPGIEGRSTQLMLKWCSDPDSIKIIEDGSPQELVAKAKESLRDDPQVYQVVDAGGQFKGLKNEYVADQFAENAHQETIIFFNENDQVFELKDVKTKKVLRISEDILDPEKYLVYLDKARSFATDIDIALLGITEIFADFKMTKDNLNQAQGRIFRDKPHGRKGRLVLQFSQAKIIFGNVEAKNIYELLIYFMQNQQDKKLYLNYLSQKQLLEDLLRRPLICLMLGAIPEELAKGNIKFETDVNVSKAILLANAFENVLITTVSGKAQDMYGKFLSLVPALFELLRDKKKCLETLAALKHVPPQLKAYIAQEMEELSESWKDPAIGRQLEVFVTGSQEIGTEIKAHEEFRQEAKMVKQDIFVGESHTLRRATQWDPDFNYHTVGWERPYKLKGIAVTVEKYISRIFENGLHTIEDFENWIKIKEAQSRVYNVVFKPLRALPKIAYAFTMIGLLFAQVASYVLGHNSVLSTRIFRQNDILENYLAENKKALLRKKNSSLLVTNNFMRQYPVVWGERRQLPRSNEDKPLHRVLVILDQTLLYGSAVQTILLAPEESEFFESYILKHQVSGQKYKKRALCLYDVRDNRVCCSGEGEFRISTQELEENSAFKEQILDAKLDYGSTNFTLHEESLIAQRIKAIAEESEGSPLYYLEMLKSYLNGFVHKDSIKKQEQIADLFRRIEGKLQH